jgi:hypothetical protein
VDKENVTRAIPRTRGSDLMNRSTVDSSMFIALSYNPETSILELELHNGAIWHVHDVPARLVEKMLDAPSKGKFYHYWIKDLFYQEWVRDIGGRELAEPRPEPMSA